MLTTSQSDPFRILESTAGLLEQSRFVVIDRDAVIAFVDSFGGIRPEPPAWDSSIHFQDPSPGGADRVAGWVFALDALNFCFWSESEDRWRVTWRNRTRNGYDALASALCRAADEGSPLWDPEYLRKLTIGETAHLLRPEEGSPDIPLLEQRHRHLVELGLGLGNQTAADLVRRNHESGVALIADVLRRFPSFRDVAVAEDGRLILFHKGAQILIADLAGALAGTDLGRFEDLAELTAFADYKVPQVMRQLGVLVYSAEAAALLRSRSLIPAGSRLEMEIRAATIWGCEMIRQTLEDAGIAMLACEIDWLLWSAGQELSSTTEPYHRTLTPFY